MKLFAYYLPQFHCIPENDKWWGEGFTEWRNVKSARPLCKNHNQPKIPLNNNYYSLDNIETLKWQSQLLKKYKVDGLIFYHYYFSGKKLLEKPAEMLLNNKNIDIDFFFCWANHSWYRSWDGTKELLQEQKYGTKKEWEDHFNYLLPFFKDERYQKKENKPLLLLFKSDFPEKNDMVAFFDKKCKENGFDGISIIETFETHSKQLLRDYNKSSYTDFIHLREPGSSLFDYNSKIKNLPIRITNKVKKELIKNNFKLLKKYNGNAFYDLMIKSYYKDMNIIRGLFFEWDNTPRHSSRGYIITPVSKKVFFKYMNTIKEDEYVFINAWNEWAEGMMLEPTEQNGYKYLEWIKEWKENENRSNGM